VPFAFVKRIVNHRHVPLATTRCRGTGRVGN
jgi:hypothetical protein